MSEDSERDRVVVALLRTVQVYGPAIEATLGSGTAQAVINAAVREFVGVMSVARPYSPAEMLRAEIARREERQR
jgi:hypothetical protein